MDLRAPEKIKGKDKRLWYFVAVELEAGKIVEIEGLYKDWKYQPIVAEGLYYYFAGRNFTVGDADPASFRILDHVHIKDYDGKRWKQDASPAYACGLMYIRSNDRLRCYDLRVPGAPVRELQSQQEPQAEKKPVRSATAAESERTPASMPDIDREGLLERLVGTVEAGAEPVFYMQGMRTRVTVRSAAPNGELQLSAQGMRLRYDYARLSGKDLLALRDALK
jgi:hypothetical protein